MHGHAIIDNHGSGYLGMARCFNDTDNFLSQKKLSYLSTETFFGKTRCTSVKSYL